MALDFPANPVNGQVYDNFYYDSTMGGWRALSVSTIQQIPAGVISQYAGSTAPGGYLLCTGQSLVAADYPALFAAIGYTYGGSGANFSLPNMQGRVPVGSGSITDPNSNSQTFTLGGASGELSHKLTTAELASHTHIQNSHNHTQDPHTHNISYFSPSPIPTGVADNNWIHPMRTSPYSTGSILSTTATNQATTATNQNTGGDGYHNNLQPYIVVNYIIKT